MKTALQAEKRELLGDKHRHVLVGAPCFSRGKLDFSPAVKGRNSNWASALDVPPALKRRTISLAISGALTRSSTRINPPQQSNSSFAGDPGNAGTPTQRSWNVLSLACMVLLIATTLAAKAPSTQTVDSGSFGIYMNGKRVATETFKVEQRSDMSVARSDLKVQDSGVAQHSEMELSANGNLLHYSWDQIQPSKSGLTVEPNDEFLTEKVSAGQGPNEKAYNVPHLLPPSTAILDDNFFLHREILLWRYLASGCSSKSQAVTCTFSPQQFGILIPAQHASETVTLDFKDKEKISVKGQQVEVSVFVLQTEDGDWFLDLNDQQKVVRMVAGGSNLEVVRD